MPATIRQVAERAGVAPMTVSYILRGQTERFRDETCAKVIKAADELGYRANAVPRIMRSGRFSAIALVSGFAGKAGWLSDHLLNGAADAALGHDHNLIYSKVPLPEGDDQTLPRVLREIHADGYLLNSSTEDLNRILHQAVAEQPAVWLNRKAAHNAVYPDELAGARDVVAHLVERGHKRLGYLQYFAASAHYSMQDRRAGFEAACANLGIPPVVVDYEADLDDEASRRAAAAPLLEAKGPTAVLCFTLYEADDLLSWVQQGIAPAMTVMPFHAGPFRWGGRNLPSVELPMSAVGSEAVEMVLKLIHGKRKRLKSRALRSVIRQTHESPPAADLRRKRR